MKAVVYFTCTQHIVIFTIGINYCSNDISYFKLNKCIVHIKKFFVSPKHLVIYLNLDIRI